MEAFISRKRRKLSTPSSSSSMDLARPEQGTVSSTLEADDDDSTDFKLAMLASMHPFLDQQLLLDTLLAHDGSVEEASASLLPSDSSSPSKKSSTAATIGYQSSLTNFATPSLKPTTTTESSNQSPQKGKSKLLSKKGKTLHLYSPEDIEAHTPCSIIHNFLPPDTANALLSELLEETPTFEKITFKLFDNIVSSPHTACFYVQSDEELKTQKTEYLYNGGLLPDIRPLTPFMRQISPLVQEAVNTAIQHRIKTHYPDGKKLHHQSPHPWRPNAAFVNCYAGGHQHVGYHSDQLTYLGPRAVIGSLSLGVAREFRVRRIIPKDKDQPDDSDITPAPDLGDAQGQISIHLPHNSLLIMHAEMQEEWKHSIAPAASIDPHPIAGNKRINITYRDYKASLHPKFTPRCRCDVPAVLRVVQRKKENHGRYFWMCHAGNVPDEKKNGCGFFLWAEFDEDGSPVWEDGKKRQK